MYKRQFVYGAFAFIATHLHQAHGLSLAAAGAVVMLFGFGGFLFATTSRWLVPRLGEPGLARWGGMVMFASLLAIALGPAWWWSVPACFATGLGFYMMHNTLQTNATQMAPDMRGTSLALFASCLFIGQSVGVALAALVVDRHGPAALFMIAMILLPLVAMGFARALRTRPAHHFS